MLSLRDKIKDVFVTSRRVKIKEPYKLSFTTLDTFEIAFIALVTERDQIGVGGCAALPGYSKETFIEIVEVLKSMKRILKGLSYREAKKVAFEIRSSSPFAASAIGTAIDLAFTRVIPPPVIRLPLVFTISASLDTHNIIEKVYSAWNDGFRTIKVKIGRDWKADIQTVKELLSLKLDNILFRFDANQGYDLRKAIDLIDLILSLNPSKVEYIEQPMPAESWKEIALLSELSEVPILLDESIYTEADIDKAAALGVKYIKLKLCKTCGFYDLIRLAKKASIHGIKVVVGNGVATDIENLLEAMAYYYAKDSFWGAFEGNAFYRLTQYMLSNPPSVKEGSFLWYRSSEELDLRGILSNLGGFSIPTDRGI